MHRILPSLALVALAACGPTSVAPPPATATNVTSATAGTPTSPLNESTRASNRSSEVSSETGETGMAECGLYCEKPVMVPRASLEPDYTKEETDDANRVLDGMKDDLLACYKKRLRANPDAHGFITVDIFVGPGGRVQDVTTTGGAILGEETMKCIVHRVEKATFQKPHGGGSLHIRVPFSLRKILPGEDDSI